MSEPVTNIEIEDVLSSIRRLVSEEGRPPRSAPIPMSEKLVLSPSLRVTDEDDLGPEPTHPMDALPSPDVPSGVKPRAVDPAVDSTEPPMTLTAPTVSLVEDDVPAPTAENGATLVLGSDDSAEPVVTDIHTAPDAAPTINAAGADEAFPLDPGVSVDPIAEAPTPEDTDEAAQIAELRASLTEILIPEDDVDEIVFGRADADAADPHHALDGGDADDDQPAVSADIPSELDHKIATLEQMLKRQSQDWAPTPLDAEGDLDAAAAHPASDPKPVDPGVPDDDVAPDAPFTEVAAEEPIAADQLVDAAEGETLADASTVAADPVTTDAPDLTRPAFVRHAPTESLDWEDHAPAVVADPRPAVADPRPADPPATTDAAIASAVAELSEEALQSIVSDIVRQELQGALGERITRNVRKLVRREINRVLMNQDLD